MWKFTANFEREVSETIKKCQWGIRSAQWRSFIKFHIEIAFCFLPSIEKLRAQPQRWWMDRSQALKVVGVLTEIEIILITTRSFLSVSGSESRWTMLPNKRLIILIWPAINLVYCRLIKVTRKTDFIGNWNALATGDATTQKTNSTVREIIDIEIENIIRQLMLQHLAESRWKL